MEQVTGSYVAYSDRSVAERRTPEPTQKTTAAPAWLGPIETGFIHNWGALARSFGMDPVLGRVHALAFLSAEPLSVVQVAAALELSEQQSNTYLDSLLRWGAVREIEVAGEPRYEADGDPWAWFMVTLKERGRREFGPLLNSVREANARAQQLRTSLHPGARSELHRIERIARFSEFVDQIAGVIETFANVGAGPVLGALRMMAKMRGPRFART
jgi:DNA-binding transcriptional regulator GbsR (MarR family)